MEPVASFSTTRRRVAAEVAAHDLQQRVVRELLDGGQALGQDLAVAAVGAVDVVVDAEQVGLADGGGFLADGEVGRAAVVVLDALVVAAQLDLVEHVLEGADDLHVALDAQQVRLGETTGVEFLFAGLLVLIERDRRKLELAGAAFLDGTDDLALGHGINSWSMVWQW